MAFTIDHEFAVNAPADVVWEVITDMASYGQWNPFVRKCQSTLKPGDSIDMQVQIFSRPQAQSEIISDYREGHGFAYKMKPAPLGALHSLRTHDIEALDGGRACYRSHFELNGWMAALVKGLLGSRLQAGFTGMSEGVRDRAEQLARERAER